MDLVAFHFLTTTRGCSRAGFSAGGNNGPDELLGQVIQIPVPAIATNPQSTSKATETCNLASFLGVPDGGDLVELPGTCLCGWGSSPLNYGRCFWDRVGGTSQLFRGKAVRGSSPNTRWQHFTSIVLRTGGLGN